METNRDEGVIKFQYTLKMAPAPEKDEFIKLEKWRALFYKLNMIGEYPIDKVGFGNLSARLDPVTFIITGTQTGHLPHLQAQHYTKVTDCNLKKGTVNARGMIPPSSESLTHYAIYLASKEIKYVFHIHHPQMWKHMIEAQHDAIPENVPYGTQEMAASATGLINGRNSGAFVMKGHEDGIISYGKTAQEAGKILLDIYRETVGKDKL
ncbi:MAG TPA: class II aldolase/adducin family protein [Bacteriovoracaceae bacterium]|nr:class II aldolase/adducin family protein [Bacteriovoracaceae bacterium]